MTIAIAKLEARKMEELLSRNSGMIAPSFIPFVIGVVYLPGFNKNLVAGGRNANIKALAGRVRSSRRS